MDEQTNASVTGPLWKAAASWFLVAILLCSGCGSPSDVPAVPETAPPPVEQLPPEQPSETPKPDKPQVKPAPAVAIPASFAPTRIEILPLTELIESTDGQDGTQLDVYLSVLDAFGSQMKAPGTLRFELYEYVQRSAEPKGQRIAIWPDIDLTDPVENQRYWRDFLRAYEFTLRTEASKSKAYVLEATYLCPSGRLTTVWLLKPGN